MLKIDAAVSGDRDNSRRAVHEFMLRFHGGEHRAKMLDRRAIEALWQKNTIRRRPHNDTKIGLRQAQFEPVDADVKTRARALWHGGGEEGKRPLPRLLLGVWGDRSSRSRMRQSAPLASPFASFFSLSAGMKSSERMRPLY